MWPCSLNNVQVSPKGCLPSPFSIHILRNMIPFLSPTAPSPSFLQPLHCQAFVGSTAASLFCQPRHNRHTASFGRTGQGGIRNPQTFFLLQPLHHLQMSFLCSLEICGRLTNISSCFQPLQRFNLAATCSTHTRTFQRSVSLFQPCKDINVPSPCCCKSNDFIIEFGGSLRFSQLKNLKMASSCGSLTHPPILTPVLILWEKPL